MSSDWPKQFVLRALAKGCHHSFIRGFNPRRPIFRAVLQRSLAAGVIKVKILRPVQEFRDDSAAALAEHCPMIRKNAARRENPITLSPTVH
jgi:hypothetical protein